jgi:hypothetical protein
MNSDVDQMDLLAEALGCADMNETQKGIARHVLAGGAESLSPQEHKVWRTLRDEVLNPHCKRCSLMIPDDEVTKSWSNGGLCSCCELMARE